MKAYKKMQALFFICLFSILLCSCSSQSNNIKSDFIKYCKNQTLTTSKGTEMLIVNFSKEKKSNNPKCILLLSIGNSDVDGQTYQWLQLSPEEQKAELRECGKMVIKYAQDNNWSNNYYIYVSVNLPGGAGNIVYDYETNDIWIPNCEKTFVKMYEKFNTFYERDLEKTQDGVNFLVENNLAHIKHNLIEYNTTLSYTVYISSEGQFDSFGQDHSTKY